MLIPILMMSIIGTKKDETNVARWMREGMMAAGFSKCYVFFLGSKTELSHLNLAIIPIRRDNIICIVP